MGSLLPNVGNIGSALIQLFLMFVHSKHMCLLGYHGYKDNSFMYLVRDKKSIKISVFDWIYLTDTNATLKRLLS